MKSVAKVTYNPTTDSFQLEGKLEEGVLYFVSSLEEIEEEQITPSKVVSYNGMIPIETNILEPELYDLSGNYLDGGCPEGYYFPVQFKIIE